MTTFQKRLDASCGQAEFRCSEQTLKRRKFDKPFASIYWFDQLISWPGGDTMRQVTDYSGVPSRAGLKLIQDRWLWLVRRMIHDASHLHRVIAVPKVDGQPACCASMLSKSTALPCHVSHPQDGLAVKPLAVPVVDVVPCLAGNQVQEKHRKFSGCGGVRIEGLLDSLPRKCPQVSVINEHHITRSWIGSVHRCLKAGFGVEHFGEAGGVATLNRQFGIGRNSILRLVECPSLGRPLRTVGGTE